jgi:hypothetical protein
LACQLGVQCIEAGYELPTVEAEEENCLIYIYDLILLTMYTAIMNTGISLIVLGMLAFLANWGSANSLFLALILCFLYSLLISKLFGEDEEDDGSISLANFLGVTFAALIFLSAPLWDEKNYCAEQISTELVNEARTLEDVIKGRQRTDVAIYSDSNNCIEDGGWTYMGGYEKFLFFLVLVIQVGLIMMFVIPFVQLLSEVGAGKNHKQKRLSNEAKELEENFNSMNGKDLFSLAYKRSIRSFDEGKEQESAGYWSEHHEAYSVLYDLFTMYVLKSFVIPFTDGSFQFPSDDGSQGSIPLNKKLVHKEFDFDEDELNNLKKKLQEEIKNLTFKNRIQYSWNFSSFQQIILSKGNSAIFFEVIQNQENSFSENSFTKLHDETLKLVDKNQLSSLRNQLEAHRKKIIDKAIQKIEKNKTKEKITSSTLKPYIEVAEMMINERDPIKRLQAKSFLEEAVERLGEVKKTPTIKQKLEKINNLIALFED